MQTAAYSFEFGLFSLRFTQFDQVESRLIGLCCFTGIDSAFLGRVVGFFLIFTECYRIRRGLI